MRMPIHTQCGTNDGYLRHRRKKEKVCAACRDAHKEYVKSQEPPIEVPTPAQVSTVFPPKGGLRSAFIYHDSIARWRWERERPGEPWKRCWYTVDELEVSDH